MYVLCPRRYLPAPMELVLSLTRTPDDDKWMLKSKASMFFREIGWMRANSFPAALVATSMEDLVISYYCYRSHTDSV
jgi:hypothetical protein